MQSKFIPSYEKKEVEETKYENKTKKYILKSKISIFLMLIILLIFILIIISTSINIKLNNNNSIYSNRMKIYGLDVLYNDSQESINSKVTRFEALKTVISATYNTSDIYNISQSIEKIDKAGDQDEIWMQLINELGFTNESLEECKKSYATIIECVKYIYLAKSKILNKGLDSIIEPEFSDYDIYSNDEKNALKDLVNNKIIENSTNKFNGNKKIARKYLDELVIKYVEQYNLITLDNEKININDDKKPSNKDYYPYTLSNIDKSVYEIDFATINSDSILPVDLYASKKTSYRNIKYVVEGYLDTILNVDYNNITFDEFYGSLSSYACSELEPEDVISYIDYVKENKIIIQGSSKVMFPIVYFDGVMYRARVKVTYNLINSNTTSNVLFGDIYNNSNYFYDIGDRVEYIDIPLGEYSNVSYMGVYLQSITSNIAGKVKIY